MITKQRQLELAKGKEIIKILWENNWKDEIIQITYAALRELVEVSSAKDLEWMTEEFNKFVGAVSGWGLWIRMTVKK